MTAQQLKNSILQMAVQGKLVPQDPNDEPASVLLERIREEKEQLIKEGEIKREKNPSVIFRGADNTPYEKIGDAEPVSIADEVPFDIPDSWEWVHPDDLGFFSSGRTPQPSEFSSDGTIPYFKVADMNTIGNEEVLHIPSAFLPATYKGKLFSAGSIVFPKNGGAVFTNKKRVLRTASLVDLNTGAYTPFSLIYPRFFFHLFTTVDFSKHFKGTALPTVDMDSVHSIMWGLPPYEEQKRIAWAIDAVLPLIKEYGSKKEMIDFLNQSFPQALKKSILQMAVQGKLVPQNPSDEPAEVLLERIREEKARLIKEGKIKKDKHESVIFRRDNSHYEKQNGTDVNIDDELPFELPDGWTWCRLSTLVQKEIRRGKSPIYCQSSHVLVFAQKCNVKSGGIDISLAKFLDESKLSKYADEDLMRDCDIVVNSTGTGTLGRIGIFHDSDNPRGFPIVPDSHITVIRAFENLSVEFIAACLCYYQPYLEEHGEGSTNQKELKPDTIKKLLIPLPPYMEQLRIVSTLQRALCTVNTL